MVYEYQGRIFILLSEFCERKFSGIEKMLKPGEIAVVDPKGAFFDFKGEGSPNFSKHAVYSWNEGTPRFLRYIDVIIDAKGKVAAYRHLS